MGSLSGGAQGYFEIKNASHLDKCLLLSNSSLKPAYPDAIPPFVIFASQIEEIQRERILSGRRRGLHAARGHSLGVGQVFINTCLYQSRSFGSDSCPIIGFSASDCNCSARACDFQPISTISLILSTNGLAPSPSLLSATPASPISS